MSGTIVSVIVPCRNERAHIAAFCDALLAQRLDDGVALEVLIADGDSDDGTRAWLQEHCTRHARWRWLPNPGRIVSTGLNLAIQAASGGVIVRMDESATELTAALANVDGVLAITSRGDAVCIDAGIDVDVPRLVGDAARAHGWRLRELREEPLALEEIFLHLVSGGDGT